MAFLIFILLNFFIAINAFDPLNLPTSKSPGSATHESITRCAFATVTAEYLRTRFGSNIAIPTTTNGICSQSVFTQIKTAFSQIKNQDLSTFVEWQLTLDYIVAHNAAIDVQEQLNAPSHFDSESFPGGSQLILQRYQTCLSALKALDYLQANEYYGKMEHGNQDFYSRSTYIELNNRQPYPDLGSNVITTDKFAGPIVRTCINCNTAVCQSNVITNLLTSGYFKLTDISNKKPVGKCSHGGSLDATANNDATGGVNKDTLISVHGYLHVPTAQTAYLASCKLLRQLRAQVSDTLFGKFLNVINRASASSRSVFLAASTKSKSDPALIYTNILNKIRRTKSFSVIRQIVSIPATDSYYKAHILSIATRIFVTIDIFRTSTYRQNSFDYGEDLSRFTGGLFVYTFNTSQSIPNTKEGTELLDLLYSKQTSDNITITVDNTCSSLLIEFVSNDTISSLTIELINSNQTISPSSILTNSSNYKSFLFLIYQMENGNYHFPH